MNDNFKNILEEIRRKILFTYENDDDQWHAILIAYISMQMVAIINQYTNDNEPVSKRRLHEQSLASLKRMFEISGHDNQYFALTDANYRLDSIQESINIFQENGILLHTHGDSYIFNNSLYNGVFSLDFLNDALIPFSGLVCIDENVDVNGLEGMPLESQLFVEKIFSVIKKSEWKDLTSNPDDCYFDPSKKDKFFDCWSDKIPPLKWTLMKRQIDTLGGTIKEYYLVKLEEGVYRCFPLNQYYVDTLEYIRICYGLKEINKNKEKYYINHKNKHIKLKSIIPEYERYIIRLIGIPVDYYYNNYAFAFSHPAFKIVIYLLNNLGLEGVENERI